MKARSSLGAACFPSTPWRVEFCLWQVRNWGSGQPSDLGSLEVESFSPGVGASAGASGREAPQDSQPAAAQEALFHVQLARRLGELEVRRLVCCGSCVHVSAALKLDS